jgi:hypothetical protein
MSKRLALAVGAVLWAGAGLLPGRALAASEAQSLDELRNTVINLLQALVEQGVMTRDKAEQLVRSAQDKAAAESAAAARADEGAVRVTYVPQVVRDEISKQVAEDVRPMVVDDVVARARTEQWGVPAALPDWIRRIRWAGDIRVRLQGDRFDDGNLEGFYLDLTTINAVGGIGRAAEEAFLNVSQDRTRVQLRATLAAAADLGSGVTAGARLVTGPIRSPVSRNQTLGQYGDKYNVSFDQAYLRWNLRDDAGFERIVLQGGRVPSPWMTSELLFDRDVTFDGVAGSLRLPFSLGNEVSSAFLTLGAHPVEEVELSSDDKWLYAGQLGTELRFGERHVVRAALGYFAFDGVQGRRNGPFSRLLDYSAPRFFQKGNTVFDIRNDLDVNTNLFALAGDYRIADAIVTYRAELPRGLRFTATGNYLKNVGWDREDVLAVSGIDADERTTGYLLEFGVGHPDVLARGRWQAFAGYRHLERDAVLDAFTDSNFHLGGTDATGYIVGFDLGVWRNTWLRARYLTANEIDGPPLAIDVVQIDLNAQF